MKWYVWVWHGLNLVLSSKDVLLSSGLMNWDREKLMTQYNAYQLYKDMKVISAASILVYNINENGELDTYKTNDTVVDAEGYQQLIQDNIHLKSYPCIYCDATVGFCSGLNNRLSKLYAKKMEFIWNLTSKIRLFHWNAIVVDFEPDTDIDWRLLTNFLIDVAAALQVVHVPLLVWVGSGTPYDLTLYRTNNLHVISMDTYVDSYVAFVHAAALLFSQTNNITRTGLGLLSSNCMSEADMLQTVLWIQVCKVPLISLWSDNPNPFTLKALQLYLR